MTLVKEVIPKTSGYPRRYLLLKDMTDEDAKILELCNMERADEFDKNGAEAWMVM